MNIEFGTSEEFTNYALHISPMGMIQIIDGRVHVSPRFAVAKVDGVLCIVKKVETEVAP